MGFFTINRRHLSPKAHYFLYFGGMASFWPFVTVFAKQLGVTEVPVGLLFTIAPITGLISMPLFGAIADRYKMKKKLFLIFNLINFVAVMCFAFLPQSVPTRSVTFQCAPEASYLLQNRAVSSSALKSKCNISAEGVVMPHEHSQVPHNDEEEEEGEVCKLICAVQEFERKDMCHDLVGRPLPSFCGKESSPTTSTLEWQIQVQPSASFISKEVLHLPVTQLYDYDGQRHSYSCDLTSYFQSCEIHCANHVLDFRLQRIPENPNVYASSVFWTYVVLVLVTWIAFAVVTSVADALCFQTLGDKPHLYGVQRQWGAMGWGLFSLVAGGLIDLKSQGSLLKDYTPCFYLILVLLVFNFFVCYNWDVKEEEKPHSLGKSIFELITTPKIFVFILACVVVGMCTGLLWQFLFWYAEDIASCENMEYIKLLQGLISIVQCFGGELPFFYVSSWFIKTLGHVHCMTLVLFAFGVRFLIYSVLTDPWHILPVELFQGVTYGIFYSNMASYAYVVSPPGSAATVQGIVGAAFEGIGVGIGSLLGGFLYKGISGRLAFRTFGLFTLAFCGLHFFSMRIITRRFTPVAQNEVEGYRNGHCKLEEMEDMKGRQFSAGSYDTETY